MKYQCHRKPNNAPDSELTEIGDFSWRYYPEAAGVLAGNLAGMQIRIPMQGGSTLTWLPVRPMGTPGEGWGFNGNLDCPTLDPSIELKTRWHGHLKSGVLEPC